MRLRIAYQLVSVLIFLAALSVLLVETFAQTGGRLVYSLDDPYIHLSVAENILQGGYGVNLSEYSSPSSSILYPFLLAAMLFVGAGDWGPLILNAVSMALAIWFFSGFYWRYGVNVRETTSVIQGFILVPVLILAINAVALPMTGMEHSLHTLASILVIVGLVELKDGKPVPKALIIGILLAPLIRFEGVALSMVAIGALFWCRRYTAAIGISVVLVLIAGFYAYVMDSLGLPVLPSSVLRKSSSSDALLDYGMLKVVGGMVSNFWLSLSSKPGTMLAIGVALILFWIDQKHKDEASRLMVGTVALVAIGAHMVLGKNGWFSRYEIYAMAIMIMALVYLYSGYLRDTKYRGYFRFIGVLLLLLPNAVSYDATRHLSGLASRNIYLQQYQMHRFAIEFFPQIVAVNDLGLVSYGNENYVLDLWGLGSEKARKLAKAGYTPEGISQLVDAAGAKYAMLYGVAFEGALPESWCKIAVLETIRVTAAFADVDFYLIDKSLDGQMANALDAFEAALPEGATLSRYACAS
ncbi:MAG: hypothetical protein ACU0CA_00790 [Paracoccaceae bacterium]